MHIYRADFFGFSMVVHKCIFTRCVLYIGCPT